MYTSPARILVSVIILTKIPPVNMPDNAFETLRNLACESHRYAVIVYFRRLVIVFTLGVVVIGDTSYNCQREEKERENERKKEGIEKGGKDERERADLSFIHLL